MQITHITDTRGNRVRNVNYGRNCYDLEVDGGWTWIGLEIETSSFVIQYLINYVYILNISTHRYNADEICVQL